MNSVPSSTAALAPSEAIIDVGHVDPAVFSLLGQVMALPPSARQAFARAWSAVDEHTFPRPDVGSEVGTVFEPEAPVTDDVILVQVMEWEKSLRSLPGKERLSQLRQALEEETSPEISAFLEKSIAETLNQNAGLAFIDTFWTFAYQRPLLSIGGFLGLCVGVWALGKGILNIIF